MKALFARIKLAHVALVLVVAVIGLAVVATVLPDSEETVSSAPQVNTDPVALTDTFDPAFRKVWVRGCVASGESAAFCRCAITEYATQLQPYEFEIAHAVAHSGGQLAELPEHVREVVKDVERRCR
jgi:hypothetical protein